nr:uncharacterized protein LOC112210930 [Halyomorpha halys]
MEEHWDPLKTIEYLLDDTRPCGRPRIRLTWIVHCLTNVLPITVHQGFLIDWVHLDRSEGDSLLGSHHQHLSSLPQLDICLVPVATIHCKLKIRALSAKRELETNVGKEKKLQIVCYLLSCSDEEPKQNMKSSIICAAMKRRALNTKTISLVSP